MEGELLGESEQWVEFKESGITIRLQRSQIASITRAPIASGATRSARSSAKAAPEITDPVTREIVAQAETVLQELDQLRDVAVKSRERSAELQRRNSGLLDEKRRLIEALHAARSEAERLKPTDERNQFGALPAGYRKQVRDYSEKLKEANTINAQIVATENALQQNTAEIRRIAAAAQNYMHALGRHSHLWTAQLRDLDIAQMSPSADEKISVLNKAFSRHLESLRSHSIPHQRVGNHLLVTVKLNDRAEATLMVDTGASTLLISRTTADRAGIRLEPDPVVMRLADGSERSMRVGMADWVQVGTARAATVPAAVTDLPLGEGIDGLLGMSFLGRFDVSIDLQKERFILRSLEP